MADIPATGLRLRRLGIDSAQEPVVYLRRDADVCQAEGLEVPTRVEVDVGGRSLIATLHMVDPGASLLATPGEAGLSESAWQGLGAREGDRLQLRHAPALDSLSHVRAKVYGHRLGERAFSAIVADIVGARYSELHLATFLTACAANRLDRDETLALTRAMVASGDRIHWELPQVMDKHCVGGLPGNRTTLIVVPIVVAAGLVMPKTSSRAITSPAGTADVMETLAPVDLDVPAIRRAVERAGGCIVWGGAVRLAPADDLLIRVERPLELDSESQLVASVLSKKLAAGATHVLIDMPVGPTAKVRSAQAAAALGERLVDVGRELGLALRIAVTDGRAPVGRGIGPALEALDALAVLRREADAPSDLRERALRLAGELLEMGDRAADGEGLAAATRLLDDGSAWRAFERLCEAQGGLREPPRARLEHPVTSARSGRVHAIDNRLLARAAKLAGAPHQPAAGVRLHVRVGDRVARGQPLFSLCGDAPGALAWSREFVEARPSLLEIRPDDGPQAGGTKNQSSA